MKRTAKTEYAAGLKNGKLHGSPLPHSSPENDKWQYALNERKCREGVNAPEPLIAAYWKGYKEGANL